MRAGLASVPREGTGSEPLWSIGDRTLPRLVGPARAEVCVVGLGGTGLTAVAALTAAGRSVLGVDAGTVAAGAAGRNGGFLLAGPAAFHHRLREQIGREPARELYGLTLEARDRMFADLGGATAKPCGSFRVPGDAEEERDIRAQYDALLEDGFAAEWRTEPVGRQSRQGLVVPGDGTFDPARRCVELANGVADHARLFGSSPVLEVSPERVVTAAGEVRADAILVCVDGALDRLFPLLKEATPRRPAVRSLRLQMLATAPAPDVDLHRAVYFRQGYDYWQQRPDGRIALGGGRDRGGDLEDTDRLGVTEAVQSHLEGLLADPIGTTAAVTHRWSGVVGYSSDDLPLADEAVEVGPGVFWAGAYSGHGNVLGTMAGAALADLALGRPTPRLVRLLREARAERKTAEDPPEPGRG